jgi:hypothetical protein
MSHYESVIEKMNERFLKNGRKGSNIPETEQVNVVFSLESKQIQHKPAEKLPLWHFWGWNGVYRVYRVYEFMGFMGFIFSFSNNLQPWSR